eukprot:GILK01004856.1.p1 GENE.GILK01004856.1~~GILK01004856.1.p1  ORF type:complete len:535 (-),score=99.61 GILK01004856.1:212-1816(-)
MSAASRSDKFQSRRGTSTKPNAEYMGIPGNSNSKMAEELETLEQTITLRLQQIDANFVKAHDVASHMLTQTKQYAQSVKEINSGIQVWSKFFDLFHNQDQKENRRPAGLESPTLTALMEQTWEKTTLHDSVLPPTPSFETPPVMFPRTVSKDTSMSTTPSLHSPPRTTPYIRRNQHDIQETPQSTPSLKSPPRTTPFRRMPLSDRNDISHEPLIAAEGAPSNETSGEEEDTVEETSAANAMLESPQIDFHVKPTALSFDVLPRTPQESRFTSFLLQTPESSLASMNIMTSTGPRHPMSMTALSTVSSVNASASKKRRIGETPSALKDNSFMMATPVANQRPSNEVHNLSHASTPSLASPPESTRVFKQNSQTLNTTDEMLKEEFESMEVEGLHGSTSAVDLDLESIHPFESSAAPLNQSMNSESSQLDYQSSFDEPMTDPSTLTVKFDLSVFPKVFQEGLGAQQITELYSQFFSGDEEFDETSNVPVAALSVTQLMDLLPRFGEERIQLMLDVLVNKKVLKQLSIQGVTYWRPI